MADPAPAVVPDGAYLEAVTQKRIRIFEEVQARQALERLNIGGEPIKWVFSPSCSRVLF
jgi:threonyl-tRNA synthetase